MSVNFDRVYKLTVGLESESLIVDGFQFAPLNIAFTVTQAPGGHVSYAEITVYNLSRDSRRKIYEEFDTVELVCGYRNSFAPIFKGNIKTVERGRDGPDQFVTMFCSSSGSDYENATVNKSWGANTPQISIIRDVAASFGSPVEIIGDFSELPKAIKGRTISSDSKSAMKKLSQAFGFSWHLQNQKMVILKDGATLPGEIYKYDFRSGMEGSPRVTTIGADIDVRLNPSIRPGDRIQVEAVTGEFTFNEVFYQNFPDTIGKGLYKIISLEHSGELYADEWTTTIEGQRQ